MRKLFYLLLCAILSLALISCGNDNTPSTSVPTTGEPSFPTTIPGNVTHTHDFGDWVEIASATCASEGTKERVCSCGEKEIISTPILDHQWIDATCEAAKTCSVCGATDGDAPGHKWTDATCETSKTCSVCGATDGEANGHTWVDGTCETAKTCSICGATDGSALGHNWNDATCETAKTCSVCGATDGEANGHTWNDATCETAKTCSVCGIVDGEALGHTYENIYCTTCNAMNPVAERLFSHDWVRAYFTEDKEAYYKTKLELGEEFGVVMDYEYFLIPPEEVAEGDFLDYYDDWFEDNGNYYGLLYRHGTEFQMQFEITDRNVYIFCECDDEYDSYTAELELYVPEKGSIVVLKGDDFSYFAEFYAGEELTPR